MDLSRIGQSVPEGQRFGSFIESASRASKAGAGVIELALSMSGKFQETGAESYGKNARGDLREMQKSSGTKIISVHVPTEISNLSGLDSRQGFSDQQRKISLDEVKKAVKFMADLGGGAVVVHTGEYQRSISETSWAKEILRDGTVRYNFIGYQEEPGMAVTYLIDDRTGKIVSDTGKSQIIREPEYMKDKKGNWIDKDGKPISLSKPEDLFKRVPVWEADKTRFKTKALSWKEIEQRAKWYNEKTGCNFTPEEVAFRIQMQTQMLNYRGNSLYHAQMYDSEIQARDLLKKALVFYKELEANVPVPDQWKIMQQKNPELLSALSSRGLIPSTMVLPSIILQEQLEDIERKMKFTHEASASALAQADTIQDTLNHVKPVGRYALEKSIKSYALAGIYAMRQSEQSSHAKRDIFIAPENHFPETGYGTHPDELIALIKNARKKMVELLTSHQIPDPYARRDNKGNLQMTNNPYRVSSISIEKAQKKAEAHIKATLHTQHLGMWRNNFVARKGEKIKETRERFRKWYIEQIKKLAQSNIIGHIHLADSIGESRHPLPAGQGELPLVETIKCLEDNGYKGGVISEAYVKEKLGEAKILTEAWKALGVSVEKNPSDKKKPEQKQEKKPKKWKDIENSYFGKVEQSKFKHGDYARSSDGMLWSGVPLE